MRWLVILALTAGTLFSQSTIFVVRHADRYGSEPDPDITPEGRRQAAALGRLLSDSRITRIFTSESVRTHQTAAPTAERFHVKPVSIDSKEIDALVRQVRAGLKPEEAALVVGHRGTVPRIVNGLTGKDVTPLEVGEYDRLEVITLFPDGRSSVITLRFGH
jgi:phosphohistidine phosphatase SixA